ncbi:MAG: TolC family protein [Vicinamibacterales bacterium]
MPNIRVLFLCSALALSGSPARAQARPQQPLALETALELAEANSEPVAIARAGVERAGGQQTRARADLFPQVSATAGYDRALASEFSGLFSGDAGTVPCDAFIADPAASLEQRLAELERAVDCGATGASVGSDGFADLPFGRKNTYRVGLSFSQNLFSGGRIGAQTAVANAGRTSADIALDSARAQLALDVVSTYYDAALSDRLLQIAEATYQQADATLTQTRLAFDSGTQPEFELLRARVARDNQRPVVIRSQSQRAIALLRLKQLLGIRLDEDLALTTPLDADTPPAPDRLPVAAATLTDAPELIRASVREAESTVRLREAAADLTRSARKPSVSLTSSYGEVAYPSGALPAAGDFRRNWTVGALMQLPLLTGGRQRADEVIARADIHEAQARLQQSREQAVVDTRTAYEELKAAQASWQASAGTVQQAERAYQIAELRYREGVSTQLELSDAQILLVQAQATRAQAARDLQVARARVALLPNLPLSATFPGGATTATPIPTRTTPTPATPAQTTQPGATTSGNPRGGG